MIDWTWLRLPIAAGSRLASGFVVSLKPDGDVEWQTQKWLQARGSHDATLGVKIDSRGDLHISGSPAKFLQGHNLFGSDDMQGLARELVARVLEQVPGIIVDDRTHAAIESGNIDLLRADLNESYSTGSRERCHAFLVACAESSSMRYRGRGLMDRETFVLGRGSRHFSLKGYCKGHELEQRGRALPSDLATAAMLAYADDAARLEFQFNARYLRRINRHVIGNWQLGDPAAIYSEHLARVNFAGTMRVTQKELETLPRELRKTYELWNAGADLKAFKLVSKPTFYRHRVLLLPHGIDIASRRPTSNVVRLGTVIEAQPKGIPSWARGTPLFFEPRAVA